MSVTEETSLATQATLPWLEGGHLNRAWGQLTDEQSRNSVNTSLNVYRDILAAIDRIVSDPRCGYETRAQFWRHAAMVLLLMWIEGGYGDTFVSDVVLQAKAMREATRTIEVRHSFSGTIESYETNLSLAIEDDNYDYIVAILDEVNSYVERTDDPYWKHHMRRLVANNPIVARAISALYDQWGEREDERGEKARLWQRFMEGMRQ